MAYCLAGQIVKLRLGLIAKFNLLSRSLFNHSYCGTYYKEENNELVSQCRKSNFISIIFVIVRVIPIIFCLISSILFLNWIMLTFYFYFCWWWWDCFFFFHNILLLLFFYYSGSIVPAINYHFCPYYLKHSLNLIKFECIQNISYTIEFTLFSIKDLDIMKFFLDIYYHTWLWRVCLSMSPFHLSKSINILNFFNFLSSFNNNINVRGKAWLEANYLLPDGIYLYGIEL